ncbi:MAG: TonB-dependent receptor [Pseudomonadota bacterium]
MNQIVVEGELQSRTLQDTQTSVTVVTGEELDRRDDIDLYDVIERIPNVTSSFGEKGFAIRGIDQRGVGAAGSGLLVNTSIDGISLPNNQSTFFGPYSTWDLGQVEVLRGPQSTQQGRNALAGAIVIRSADPTYDFEVKGRGEVGQRNTFGGAFALNAPIVEDKVAVRFSADHIQTDGFVENPTLGTEDYDFRDQTTLRAKARFDPNDDFKAIVSATYSRSFGGEDLIERDLFPRNRFNFSNLPAEEGSEHGIIGLRTEYQINEALSLETESSFYRNDYKRLEDSDFSAVDTGFFLRDLVVQSFEQDVQLNFETDQVSGVFGGFFTRIDEDENSVATFVGSLVDPSIPDFVTIDRVTDRTTDTTSFAIFGEVEYRPIDKLGLIAGGRYDRETVEFEDTVVVTTSAPIGLPLPPADTASSDTTFDAFLPKVGVVYDWTDDLSTGFTVQRGYRAGGTSRNILTGEITEFDPESTWNFELALRSQWFDGALTANANVFYTLWRDQQVDVFGPSGSDLDFFTVNAGESRLIGGEIELRANPTDNLELFGSVGIANTEFTDFVDNGIDFAGNEFPRAPEVTGAFGASYFFDNGFELHGDASYTGGNFNDIQNSADSFVDGRFLLNARAGYQGENWGAFLYVRNLLDEDYLLQILGDRARSGEPLTVGAFATFSF